MAKTGNAKVVRTKESEEERLAASLISLRRDTINEPSWAYKIGEEIRWGNHDKTIVTDIADGGKYIKVHVLSTNTNYGRPYQYEHDAWIEWHRVQPLRDHSRTPVISSREDHLYFLQTQMEGVIQSYYSQGVELNPPYQRDIVWKDEQRQALLDSIFMNADIGKFVFAKRKYEPGVPGLEIVDGKQRFVTMMTYMENRWAWRGRYFYDLHRFDQHHIESYPAPQCILEEPSLERILKIFLRVNVSGVPMESSHIKRVEAMLAKLESQPQ